MSPLLALIASPLLTPSAHAFCGTYVGGAGAELYNNASQVVLARQRDRTTLTLVNDFEGDPGDFAVVIPVPEVMGEEDVQVVSSKLIARAEAYSEPRLVTYTCDDFSGGTMHSSGCRRDYALTEDASAEEGGALGVTVAEAFTVGEYDVVILSAEESAGLMTWLDYEGYALPDGAEPILEEYIAAGAFFFAAKVSLEAQDAEEGAWLSPLQFSYEAEMFSLPIRIGTITSPGVQDLLIYTITDASDGEVRISNYPEIALEDECMWRSDEWSDFGEFYDLSFTQAVTDAGGAAWSIEYSWAPSSCDPCSSDPLTGDELADLGFDGDAWEAHFTRLHVQYTPQAADQDLVLYTTNMSPTEQIRYIEYKATLEDRFPICGEGWSTEPGTCDEDGEEAAGCATANPRYPALALIALVGLARRGRLR